jgi:hypothetical protein
MKIAAIPKEFKIILNRYRDLFSLRQFRYFSIYVYSLLILEPEHKNVCAISKEWVEPVCRSSLSKFLSEVRWEFDKVLRRNRTRLIRSLSCRKKNDRNLQIILDDTTLSKFGLHIFGAGWYRKHKNSLPFLGVQIVVLCIMIDGWAVPADFRIYVKEEECEHIRMRFETKLHQAAGMLKNLKIPMEYMAEVMFDSWYLNSQVTEVITGKGWHWISRCKSDRCILWENESKRVKLKNYVSNVQWDNLNYRTDRKHPAAVGHQRIGCLKGTGRVKIVISSLTGDGSGSHAFFCTDNTRLPMVTVIKKYETRWKIEVFFKDARKCFALERWQFRDTASVVHHLCLTIVAAVICACIRQSESEKGNVQQNESWGEFTRRLKKQNQRIFLRYFLEKNREDYDNNFEELCSDLGI